VTPERRNDATERRRSTGDGYSRRALLGGVAGLTVSLAGCQGNSTDNTATTTTFTNGDSGPFTVLTTTELEGADLNPYQRGTSQTPYVSLFDALVLPVEETTGAIRTSGHEASVGGETVSVPCAVADYERDGSAYVVTFDDRFSYWNGDPLNARAYWIADRLSFLLSGGQFDDDAQFTNELVSDTEYRRSFGDLENLDRFDVYRLASPGAPPLPPSFTESWLEQAEDATTESEISEIRRDIASKDITFQRFADKGYGSGAYELRSSEDIVGGNGRYFVLHRRSDHPGSAPLETVRIRVIPQAKSNTFQNIAISNNQIDYGDGLIASAGGDLQRDGIPENLTQLGTFRSPRQAATQLLFDWSNTHLRRLWVRRALVAAMPLAMLRKNVWGAQRAPPATHSGLLARIAERVFEQSFVDSLADYPIASDTDRASEWLRRAGYSREDGTWYDSDGDPLRVPITIPDNLAGLSVLVDGLSSFGVEITRNTVPRKKWGSAVAAGGFGVTAAITPAGWTPDAYYSERFLTNEFTVFGSPLVAVDNPLDGCTEADTVASVAGTVTLPEQPGALEIEDVDYADGGQRYRWDGAGVDRSICGAVGTIQDSEASDQARREAMRTAARWYNYAIPNFVFAERQVGLWGDTGSYAFPSAESLQTMPYTNGNRVQYAIQAGLIQPTAE